MTCVNKDGCYLHDTRTPTSKIKKIKKKVQTGKMEKKKMQQKSKSELSPQNLLEEDDSEVSEGFFFPKSNGN